MRLNSYRVLSDCIERGLEGGWNKAHKHTNNPSEEYILEQQHNYIMLEISEYFDFDEPSIEIKN